MVPYKKLFEKATACNEVLVESWDFIVAASLPDSVVVLQVHVVVHNRHSPRELGEHARSLASQARCTGQCRGNG